MRFRHSIPVLFAAASILPAVYGGPTPAAGPRNTPGNGLYSRWVNVEFSINPNSLAEARAVLTLQPGDEGYISEAAGLTWMIDYADDFGYGGNSPDEFMVVPFGLDNDTGDHTFAVEYSGYLNVFESGFYAFDVRHDDGFSFTLGGELISEFPFDTGPRFTTSDPVFLAAGMYPFSFIGWEQGGAFINELSWAYFGDGELGDPFPQPGPTAYTVIPTAAYFTSLGIVPEASTWVAMVTTASLVGGMAWRRRR